MTFLKFMNYQVGRLTMDVKYACYFTLLKYSVLKAGVVKQCPPCPSDPLRDTKTHKTGRRQSKGRTLTLHSWHQYMSIDRTGHTIHQPRQFFYP